MRNIYSKKKQESDNQNIITFPENLEDINKIIIKSF